MITSERLPGIRRWLAGFLLALVLPCVHAQTIDEVSVQPQGDDIVARVTFNATVRFLQQTPANAAELYRIAFDLVAADEAVVNQTTEESKRVGAADSALEFTLTYRPTRERRSKELTLSLRASAQIKVRQGPSSRSIDIVFVGLAPKKAPVAAAAPPAAPPSDKRYAIVLQSVPAAEVDKLVPVPDRFKSYEVFDTNSVVDGVATLQVNLGYFATQDEAEAVRQPALERFPQATVVDLAARREQVLKSASEAAAGEPKGSKEAAESGPLTPVEARARELIASAREALAASKNDDAVNSLNQLLLLPPNSQSQEAQELIGLAWERAGDPRRARVEYELYLKLFPEGEGAQRVSQRLASLDSGAAAPASAAASSPDAGKQQASDSRRFTGNIAQYYYGGKSRSQSLVNIAAGIDQSTLTRTTESAIVTSADLGARYATTESDTRVVLRGTNSANLQSDSHSASLLSAAYLDYKRLESGLAVRLGRQSSISGGLLGLFDGASVTYPVRPGWKIDLMGGVPANPLVSAPSERLFAAVVEADGIFDRWGGDAYLIDQTTEGIANRRALGGELRYSDERWSMYSLLDYDILFRKINAASLQGSFQAAGQTTITMLLDVRKAPSLQLTNALISSGATSLKTLMQMQSLSLDDLRDRALQTTARATQALISASRPLSEKWQIAADLRYSAIGALPAVGDFQATPATGAQYGATLQLTGSNLYSSRDINNFNMSYLTTPIFKGLQVSYNNLTGFRDNDITVEPSIRLYTQNSSDGSKLNRISPGLRGTYRLSRRASLLGEGIVEHSKFDGPLNNDTTNSVFFYFGYRYELF